MWPAQRGCAKKWQLGIPSAMCSPLSSVPFCCVPSSFLSITAIIEQWRRNLVLLAAGQVAGLPGARAAVLGSKKHTQAIWRSHSYAPATTR